MVRLRPNPAALPAQGFIVHLMTFMPELSKWAASIHPAAEKVDLPGIYIYNGVKSEKHALSNPVSALELALLHSPLKGPRSRRADASGPGALRIYKRSE